MNWNFAGVVFLFSICTRCFGVVGKPVLDFPNPLTIGKPSDSSPALNLAVRQEIRDLGFIRPNHTRVQWLKEKIHPLFPQASLSFNETDNTLTVLAAREDMKRIRSIVSYWDQPIKQCRFDVQIIEISNQNQDDYSPGLHALSDGLRFNYDPTSGSLNPPEAVFAMIQRLIQSGAAKIVAKPHVTVLNLNEATIQIGDLFPYITSTVKENGIQFNQLQQIDTGLQLKLIPKIISGNVIETSIDGDISSIKFFKEIQGTDYPVVSKRFIRTQVQIPNTQTLVIGGLLQENEKENTSDIPILSRIPLIKKWVTSRRSEHIQTDIVIFITPTLL